MTFFGYTNESEMRAANPAFADHLIKIASRRTIRACNRDRECTGSMNGVFYYADGTTDSGRDITTVRAVFEGAIFQWNEQ